jgi:FMN phosphatase YigB (HAD superfamily)
LGREPAEAVFIDDFAHNIEGARAVGMAAIHYQPGIDLVAELAALGVTI